MKMKATILVSLLSILCVSNSHAAVDFWFSGNSNLSDTDYSKTVSGITADITGWASGSSAGDNHTLEDLRLYSGGIGVISTSSSTPHHAIGDFDFEELVLFEFSEPVAITEIGNGYRRECMSGSDSNCPNGGGTSGTNWTSSSTALEATILALTEGNVVNTGSVDMSTTSTTDLASADWTEFGGNFNSSNRLNFNTGPGQVLSNIWAIGNANELLGASGSGYEDFFKLKLVKVLTCDHSNVDCDPPPGGGSVPAPGTALLLGLGLLMVRARAKTKS